MIGEIKNEAKEELHKAHFSFEGHLPQFGNKYLNVVELADTLFDI